MLKKTKDLLEAEQSEEQAGEGRRSVMLSIQDARKIKKMQEMKVLLMQVTSCYESSCRSISLIVCLLLLGLVGDYSSR